MPYPPETDFAAVPTTSFNGHVNKDENLFRAEAIRALNEATFGRPICSAPVAWNWATAILMIAFIVAILAAPFVRYHRTEMARGWLAPSAGVVRVVAGRNATVEQLLVEQGSTVRSGSTLAVLASDRHLQDGGSRHRSQASQLQDELSEIDVQSTLLRRQLQSDLGSIEIQLEQIAVETRSVEVQRQQQIERVAVARDQLARLERASAAVAEWQLLQQRTELAEQRSVLESQKQKATSLTREAERQRSALQQLPILVDTELSKLRARRAGILQQLVAVQSDGKETLVASVAGTVGDLRVRPGETVAPGQVLMTVLPDDAELRAQVYLPSRAAGHVQPGQQVDIAFDAFPRQVFGIVAGRVLDVSNYVTLPTEVPDTSLLHEPSYKVEVALESTALSLRPGMKLTVRVLLEERNLVDWILEPLRRRVGV